VLTLRVWAGLAVTAALSAAAASGAVGSASAAPTSTAVVSFTGSADAALEHAGVAVLSRQPALHSAVVRGTDAQLRRLAGAAGVRGIAADSAFSPTGTKGATPGGSVFAWQGLGGAAGRSGSGAGVTVAVVDTGVSDTAALNRASGRLVDGGNSSSTGSDTDGYGHGTFMAGIVAGGPIAGTGNRAIGVAPAATVVNVKVADGSGNTSLSRLMAGLEWVLTYRASHSIDIASFSFSRTRPGDAYGPDPLTWAVEQLRTAGITVVVPSGNVPTEVGDPGFDPHVLTVGAADVRERPRVAAFSGSGVVAGVRKPDVVASGVGVLSVLPPDSTIAEGNPASQVSPGLWRGSGTSQATATTAGAAAVFLQSHPAASPDQVKASLRRAASPLGTARAGAGLLNLAHRGVDGTEPDAGSYDGTGTGDFDSATWQANSWGANSWGANSWGGNTWGGNTWGGNTWGGSTWGGSTWGGNTWGGSTWGGSTWGGSSWGAASWTDEG
jgi:serine protease AprX